MPELPEVETVRQDLLASALNVKINKIIVDNQKTVNGDQEEFIKILIRSFFVDILRRGKLLIFKLNKKDLYLLVHLKMTGQLIYLSKEQKISGGHSLSSHSFEKAVGGELPNKFTRVIISFASGSKLFFNDLRKFGYMKLVSKEELDSITEKNYGPEPLGDDFIVSKFEIGLKNKRRNIKAVLLDQKFIAGLGNIYVDEVLFASGVRPSRLASSLTKAEIVKIYQEIRRILALAIKNRGTTFSNYVDSKGKKGNFSNMLKVYGRGKENCFKCYSAIIKTKIAGRGTHYCPNCQK
jgi:formamidopyrimidine-DNA glycosylase